MHVAVGHFCAHRLLVLATWSPPSVTLLVLLERVFPRLHFLSRNLKRDSKGLGEVPCVPRQTAYFTSFPHRTMRLLVSVCYLSMGIPCSACLQRVFKASSRETCQFSNLDSENLFAEAEEPARLGPWRIHVAWRRASPAGQGRWPLSPLRMGVTSQDLRQPHVSPAPLVCQEKVPEHPAFLPDLPAS